MANFLTLFIDIFFNILIIALFIRILLSWFRISEDNIFIQILFNITNPILLPFQKIIPPLGMIDFSPIAAFIALEIVRELLIFAIRLIFK
ncbi:YggT family protein [Patescibacteria group bacterium]|nr:YggT family protein [Patescibacteria group bacterium]